MYTALSNAQLARLRTQPHGSRWSLAVHRPMAAFHADFAASQSDFPASRIKTGTVYEGDITKASAGATVVMIGGGEAASPQESIRVRYTRGATSATKLFVAEYGSGLIQWTAVTQLKVLDEFRPWSIHHRVDQNPTLAAETWRVDFDFYTEQTRFYGPVAVMGPPFVGFMEGDPGRCVASYVGDRSYSMAAQAAASNFIITSQKWEFPNGQVVTSALGTSLNPILITYVNTSSGGRTARLTVTDSNGSSHVAYRLNWVFETSDTNALPTPVEIDTIQGGWKAGGYTARVRVLGKATSAQFAEGAECVIFEQASYGDNAVNPTTTPSATCSIGGNYPFRENIVFRGWIQHGTVRFNPFTCDVSFDLGTIDKELEKTSAYDLFLKRTYKGGAQTSDWDMAASLSIDRAAVVLAKYRSTIATVTDFYPGSGLLATEQMEFQSLPRGSLWSQLRSNVGERGMMGYIAADMQSSLWMGLDPRITGLSANTSIIVQLNPADLRDEVVIEENNRDDVAEAVMYGVDFRINIEPPNSKSRGAISPGSPIGYYGGRREITRGLVAVNQATLNTWVGNWRATENGRMKRVIVPLAGNYRIDSVPICRVRLKTLGASSNSREYAFKDDDFFPYETQVKYDARTGMVLTTLVMERIMNGLTGSKISLGNQS